MAGSPYYLRMPKVMGVKLTGRLRNGVSAKDVIFQILQRLTVKGGAGYVLEYYGPGVATLDVPERATIANMGTELGATTSIFPSDKRTLAYLKRQGREAVFSKQSADPGAPYDEHMAIDLSALEPLIACPDSPDNIRPVSEVAGIPVNQVAIGSCTNSSYSDLMVVASMLKGAKVHPAVSLVMSPGSKQVLQTIASNGALADLIAAGARILESACGPCAGMGQVPASGAVSVRSFNRNLPRAAPVAWATASIWPAQRYARPRPSLVRSPTLRDLGISPKVRAPARFLVDE